MVNARWSGSAQRQCPTYFVAGRSRVAGDGGVCVSARHLIRVQELLGRKWDLLVLVQLGQGPLRHKDLKSRIREIDAGLNDGVLSKTLRRLADDGLIYKQPVGKRHAHALTDLGRKSSPYWRRSRTSPTSHRILMSLGRTSAPAVLIGN